MRQVLNTLLVLLLSAAVGRAAEPEVRLVGPEEILARADAEPGATVATFRSDAGLSMELLLDPSDPAITNPFATDRFHPFPEAAVRDALREVRPMPGEALEFTVYCLPGLPQTTLSSFCSGLEIFLAPALGDPSPTVIAYTVTHELGHVVQHRHLPGRTGRGWDRYRELRGLLDESIYRDDAVHIDRPGEIFAEDFRQLYGGPLATASDSQENRDLPLAAEIVDLGPFFDEVLEGRWAPARTFLEVRNVPNPFNPLTTIRVQLREEVVRAGGMVRVEVYDVRGRRVRALPPVAVSPLVSLPWDGTDARGRRVASGRYYYTVRLGEEQTRGQMLLVQ